MKSDELDGLKSRFDVIEEAFMTSENPSDALRDLRDYYARQIVLLERKSVKYAKPRP